MVSPGLCWLMDQSSSPRGGLTGGAARALREKLRFRRRRRLRQFAFEFQRCELPEAGMGAHLVELTPELFDHHLRVDPVLEPLHAQALVAKFTVEGLIRPVLPGLARINVCRVDLGVFSHFRTALETN